MCHISSEQRGMDIWMFKFPIKDVKAFLISPMHVAYQIMLVYVIILINDLLQNSGKLFGRRRMVCIETDFLMSLLLRHIKFPIFNSSSSSFSQCYGVGWSIFRDIFGLKRSRHLVIFWLGVFKLYCPMDSN